MPMGGTKESGSPDHSNEGKIKGRGGQNRTPSHLHEVILMREADTNHGERQEQRESNNVFRGENELADL
jgi:hypothetical protein